MRLMETNRRSLLASKRPRRRGAAAISILQNCMRIEARVQNENIFLSNVAHDVVIQSKLHR